MGVPKVGSTFVWVVPTHNRRMVVQNPHNKRMVVQTNPHDIGICKSSPMFFCFNNPLQYTSCTLGRNLTITAICNRLYSWMMRKYMGIQPFQAKARGNTNSIRDPENIDQIGIW
jgi:hypothetical protein